VVVFCNALVLLWFGMIAMTIRERIRARRIANGYIARQKQP
jgi:hypothetical protein